MVALFSPYIQQYVTNASDQKRYVAAKKMLLNNVKQYNDAHIDAVNTINMLSNMEGERGFNSASKKEALSEAINGYVDNLRRKTDFYTSVYDNEPVDLPFRQVVDLQRDSDDLFIRLYKDYATATFKNTATLDYLIDDVGLIAANTREQRLIYKINAEANGDIKVGPVIFATCQDEGFEKLCESDKDIYNEALEAARKLRK